MLRDALLRKRNGHEEERKDDKGESKESADDEREDREKFSWYCFENS